MWSVLLGLALSAAHAQDIPVYKMTRIVVTPDENAFGVEPDAVIEIPENAPGRAATLDEALKGASGVVIARDGGAGQKSALFFRGSGSEHTLVLLDGVEVNDPTSPAGAFDFATMDMNLVERIEIFKGPQALRFGSGAMGGVINIVTRKGSGPLAVRGSVRGGSYGTHAENVSLLGGAEKSHYAFSLNRFETEGFSAAKGLPEKDGNRLWAAALRAGYSPSDKTEFDLVARGAVQYTELDFSTVSPYVYSADDPDYHVNSTHMTDALSASHIWNENLRSRLSLGYDYMDRRYRNEPDLMNASSLKENRWGGTFTAGLANTYRASDSSVINFGPDYRRENTNEASDITGLFGDWNYKRTNFFGDAGLRLDHHSKFGEAVTGQVAPGYQWRGHIFKARYATAFKAPSLYQLHDPTYGNENLNPERVQGGEVSVQKAMGTMYVGLSAFRYEYRDLIQAPSRYENVGRARSQGTEIELTGGDSLKFEAAYTYTDARNLATGNQLARRPFHSWRLGLEKEFSEKLHARMMFYGMGKRNDFDALTSASVEPHAYNVLDISMNYSLKKNLQLTLSAENVLDEDYETVAGYGTSGAAFYAGLQAEL